MQRKKHVERTLPMLALLLLSLALSAQEQVVAQAPSENALNRTASSSVAPADAKRAEKLFQRALRLHSEDHLNDALGALEESHELNPAEPGYLRTEEFVRQQIVGRHLQQGNALLEQHHKIEAMAEFREALTLDPSNLLAQQMMNEASGLNRPQSAVSLEPATYASEPELKPQPGTKSFHVRGNSRELLEQIARAFGLTPSFDESLTPRTLRFDMDDVDFSAAMDGARRITRTFEIPVSPTEVMFASDTQDVRRRLERMSLRTFYIPEAANQQELQEFLTMMRTLLDVRFITTSQNSSTITVRAPARSLDAIGQLIADLSYGRPQVVLEIQAMQVDENLSRALGISLPLQFNLFNINTEARKLLNNPAAQAIVNQLISGGLINAADAAAVLALLSQQSSNPSPLLKPFVTFGGGKARTGVSVPPLAAQFSYSHSLFSSLQRSTVRAEQGHAASFHVGERYPVLTSSFSPLASLPNLPSSLRTGVNNNLQPLIPSYSYEDLGISLKATPTVNAAAEVTLQLEVNIKALGGTSINNVPVISNREYKGTITTRDGETSLVAGAISLTDQRSVVGVPLVSLIPGIGPAFSTHNKDFHESQLLVLITPHIVRAARPASGGTETYFQGGN